MLIHPWDSASHAEWSEWIAAGRDFGTLITNGGEWPVVVPTHFTPHEDHLLVHLARPNPVHAAVQRNPRVVLSVVDDYAFIPSYWRVPSDQSEEQGVPTSYYSAVQFHCTARLIEDAEGKAALLTHQLAHFQPDGRHGEMSSTDGPYHRMLPGIFGLRLDVIEVRAKTKVDDNKPLEMRQRVSTNLGARAQGRDLAARAQQQRRMARD